MAASRHDDLDARLRAANVARRQDDAFFDALAEHASASAEAPARRRPTAARITAAALGTGLLLSGGAFASAYILIKSDGHHLPEPRPATTLQPSLNTPSTDASAGGGDSNADVPGGSAAQGDDGRAGQSPAHADGRPGHQASDRPQPPGNAYGLHGQTPQGGGSSKPGHGHHGTTPSGHAYGHTDHKPPANGHAHDGQPRVAPAHAERDRQTSGHEQHGRPPTR